jgi:hypothetical protein
MSDYQSIADSSRSNRREYRKLLKQITNCFRHAELVGVSDGSLVDESDVLEDDEDTKEYVRAFRIKVNPRNQIEQKFAKSRVNQNYRFPNRVALEDSESSLRDLENGNYDLKRQNENIPLDSVDQLVELFYTVGRLEKPEIRELLW